MEEFSKFIEELNQSIDSIRASMVEGLQKKQRQRSKIKQKILEYQEKLIERIRKMFEYVMEDQLKKLNKAIGKSE